MATKVRRDPDNKWVTWVNWNPFIDQSAESQPGGPQLTITITNVSWNLDAALTEEAETPSDDDGGYTYLFGSGGVVGVSYPVTCTITYTATSPNSTANKTDCTQDHSFEIEIEEQ